MPICDDMCIHMIAALCLTVCAINSLFLLMKKKEILSSLCRILTLKIFFSISSQM